MSLSAYDHPVTVDKALGESGIGGGEFVGSKTCRLCHKDVSEEWKDTRHAKVMRKLYTEDNHSISSPWGTEKEPKVIRTNNEDRKYTLYMKGKKYWVTIHDKFDSSKDKNYQIDAVGYTSQTMYFSWIEEKQTLLVLPFNYWNNSTEQERWGDSFDIWWFNPDGSLLSDEDFANKETFYAYENRCAQCHLTGMEVEKWKETPKQGRSTDVTNIWTTTEFGIGCEKCHGPGGNHVKSKDIKDIANPGKILSVSKSEECDQCHQSGHPINYNNGFWTEFPMIFDEKNPLAKGKHYNVGENLADMYVPNVRKKWAGTEYFQQGKSYTMQLKDTEHFKNDMDCKTCHDPHTQKLRMPANDLCTSCHQDQSTKEHFGMEHARESIKCVDCHMPYAMISYLRSQRYDGRVHVFKPITPTESLKQFDFLKEFIKPDADPENKLTKHWKLIQDDPEGCYDSWMYPKNSHYCTSFDVLPNACSSCHKSEFPTPGKFDDKERGKLIKAEERYQRLLDYKNTHKPADYRKSTKDDKK